MRVFIGLPLPQAGMRLAAELRQLLDENVPHLAWTRPEMLHITLSFLGELGESSLAAARRAFLSLGSPAGPGSRGLPAARPEAGPARFAPGRLLFFPGRGPARVLVLAGEGRPAETQPGSRPPGDADSLSLLHTELCRALARESRLAGLPALDAEWPDAEKVGSKPRRAFSPHISLARWRGGRRRLELEAGGLEKATELLASRGSLLLDRLVLFESRLGRSGARYEILEELGLGSDAANSRH